MHGTYAGAHGHTDTQTNLTTIQTNQHTQSACVNVYTTHATTCDTRCM